MALLCNGEDLFARCEYGGGANKHPVSNSGLTANGLTLTQAERAPVTATSGYLYSGETFVPAGLSLEGQQVILQKKGCRPRSTSVLWDSWTSENGYRTGAFTFNRDALGVEYVIAQLWGPGGGSTSGYTSNSDRAGGGSGACAAACIRIPASGSITIYVGEGGGVSSGVGEGSAGETTYIESDAFVIHCIGGGGGSRGSGGDAGFVVSADPTGGNMVMIPMQSGDGSGASGGTGTGSRGAARDIRYVDYCPEGGEIFVAGSGAGGAAPDYGTGNGNKGANGRVRLLY